MDKTPYTREQAEKICSDFQYLVGTELVKGERRTKITYVAICPFDVDNDDSFIEYHHYNEGLADYKYINPNGEYDVIAIAMEYPYNLFQTISRYCEENDVNYSFPV